MTKRLSAGVLVFAASVLAFAMTANAKPRQPEEWVDRSNPYRDLPLFFRASAGTSWVTVGTPNCDPNFVADGGDIGIPVEDSQDLRDRFEFIGRADSGRNCLGVISGKRYGAEIFPAETFVHFLQQTHDRFHGPSKVPAVGRFPYYLAFRRENHTINTYRTNVDSSVVDLWPFHGTSPIF